MDWLGESWLNSWILQKKFILREKIKIKKEQANGTKKCIIKREIKFHECKKFKTMKKKTLKHQLIFRNKDHKQVTEKVDKVV